MAIDDYSEHHWRILDAGEIKVSSSAQELWDNAMSYFNWCDSNPIVRRGTIKSGKQAGEKLKEELPRVYHLKALCLHCGIEESWLKDIMLNRVANNEYYPIVSRILGVIYSQQYELAAVSELNPIFISKALNMDKEEAPTGGVKVTIVGEQPPLANSELEVLEKPFLENGENQNSDFEKS